MVFTSYSLQSELPRCFDISVYPLEKDYTVVPYEVKQWSFEIERLRAEFQVSDLDKFAPDGVVDGDYIADLVVLLVEGNLGYYGRNIWDSVKNNGRCNISARLFSAMVEKETGATQKQVQAWFKKLSATSQEEITKAVLRAVEHKKESERFQSYLDTEKN